MGEPSQTNPLITLTVLYLLSDKSDMISGITMPVDGGALAN